ncbi:MAG TPA: citrate (Si)-synthase [Planctomycetaceae bacterium]|nr:citrate (Si)-synthase [Planctomycetaceae bacterium]
MADTVTVIYGDKRVELPILHGTDGEPAIDIRSLRAEAGLITYDPSLANTALCRSDITFIDGEEGILRYRGIPIEQFTERPDFVEVVWLLIFGRLPSKEELAEFSDLLTDNELLHEGLKQQYQQIPVDAPPMAILSAVLNGLTFYHQQFLALEDTESLVQAAARLISKVRTIAAYACRRSQGLPFMYPDPKLRYCANFLHMMLSIPYRQYVVTPEVEDALNLLFILHADHEQNCSTSTVRIVGSARANLFASCAAGVCALWGPLHGGANVEVIEMLERIHAGGVSPEECIRMAKDKSSDFRLYGFGHRVYRSYDPRAKILREACHRVFAQINRKDPLLDIARKLEELALADPYFNDRLLFPNVDFYSGILLRAIGIPTNMFTVCFAIGRLPGWIAQWKEQHDDSTSRILRPRQIYTGPGQTDYVPMTRR